MGALSECGRVLRLLVGGHTPPAYMKDIYERPLPLLGVAVGFPRRRTARIRRRVIAFFFDLFFCLAFGVTGILVQYRYHDGAFRAMVPIGMLGGFFLWRRLASRHAARGVAWLAYFFAAAGVYLRALLRLPFYLLRRLALFVFFRALLPLWLCYARARARRVSRRICQRQLQMARVGLARPQRSYKIKEEEHVKQKKGRRPRLAVDHPHSDRGAVLRDGGDRRKPSCRISSKEQDRRGCGERELSSAP